MELQIQDLVESIKRDGISEAEKKAAVIIADAKTKADALVREGTDESARLIGEARKEVAVMQQSGRSAIEQAGRDVLLSLDKAIRHQFDALLEGIVTETLTGEQLISLIEWTVQSSLTESADGIVEMGPEDFRKLVGVLKERLVKEMKAGLEIRPSEKVQVGFRIMEKNGKSFFDFSSTEIARLLAPRLNPAIQEILMASVVEK